MKVVVLLLFLLGCAVQTQAQGEADSIPALPDTIPLPYVNPNYWRTKLNFAINFNQASFSSNWSAGGINSLGLNSLFNFKANYKHDEKSWDNEVDLLYGFVNNDGQGFRKTLDRVFLDTKYGYRMTAHWNLFTAFNLLTQFAEGYNFAADGSRTLISDSFAPFFLTSTWGMEYRPREFFKMRLSPFAPRLTYVRNPARFIETLGPEPFGVTEDDNLRLEWLAFQMFADFNKTFAEKYTLKCRYLLFANYETLAWRTVDHRLDVNFTAKVSRFFTFSVGAIMIYDLDQAADIQFSQIMNVGFLYTFQNYKE